MRVLIAGVVAFALAFTAACGGGSDGGTNPPPGGGAFTIGASGSSLTIARNASSSLTITITRTGTFTGSVSLSTTTLPTGVTAAFSPPQIDNGQTSSTMTVSVGGAAATGTTTFSVRGTSAGQNMQTVDITLTVTAPPGQSGPFTLSMSASSHLVHPTNVQSTYPIITITRNAGFTGSVAFTASGLPQTLIVAFTPSSTTGNTTNAIILNTGAPNGTYTATIRGASAQGDQTITFTIVVASASTGNIKWKFCSGSLPRVFFAVKDGTGPWTRIMPAASDTSYSFNITSGAGQVAEINIEGGGFRTTVYSYTAQEMSARAASQCTLIQNVTSRTVNGFFAGVTGFRTSQVGMGWWFGSANGNGSFSLLNLPPGPLDVMAVRNGDFADPSAIPVDRMIIRRGINPASGATLPVFDFGAAESFAPTQALWTFGSANGEAFGVSQSFFTAAGTTASFTAIPAVDGAATNRTLDGVPLAQTIAGDLHQVIATIATTGPSPTSPLRATRQIIAYTRTVAPRQLSFGSAMPAPTTILPIAGLPAGRLRVQGSVPSEYTSGITLDFTQTASSNHMTIHATRGFLGAGNLYDLSMPDLTGVTGWDTQFAIRAGVPVQWWASGGGPTLDFFDARYLFNSIRSRWTGALTGISPPADGAVYLFARVTGTVTP